MMSDFFTDLFSKPGHVAPAFSPSPADREKTEQPEQNQNPADNKSPRKK
jgi:hypothetical protein